MNQFGTKMKQKYKEYNGQEPITTLAREKYPDDLSKRTFKLYSDCMVKETVNQEVRTAFANIYDGNY